MNKSYLPYLLPTLSILIIAIFAFANPSITGSAIIPYKRTPQLASQVKITTNPEVVIPPDAMVYVTLDNTTKNMTFAQFVKQTKKPSKLQEGTYTEINYQGKGYTGTYTYTLSTSKLGLKQNNQLKNHEFNVKLVYNGRVFVENTYKYTT